MIYPVNSAIQRLSNWSLDEKYNFSNFFGGEPFINVLTTNEQYHGRTFIYSEKEFVNDLYRNFKCIVYILLFSSYLIGFDRVLRKAKFLRITFFSLFSA